jgi:SsrA-binding protein
MSKKVENKDDPNFGVMATNRKAHFDYHLLDKFEAGMVLTGNEIKSIRDGGLSISEAYVKVNGTEAFLVGAHIRQYSFSHDTKYDPLRPRKLLLHESEINKLRAQTTTKGLTIIPLRVYLKKGRAKLEVALARHKDAPDKRRDIISREKALEARRAMKSRG